MVPTIVVVKTCGKLREILPRCDVAKRLLSSRYLPLAKRNAGGPDADFASLHPGCGMPIAATTDISAQSEQSRRPVATVGWHTNRSP
jgi:hypothetical protein